MADVFRVTAPEPYMAVAFIYYTFTGIYMSAGADQRHSTQPFLRCFQLLIKLHRVLTLY